MYKNKMVVLEAKENILITGGCGFIGSNFIRKYIGRNINIFNVDDLTYAGNLENLKEIEEKENYHFFKGKIQDKEFIKQILIENNIDSIINFAAESHVDRSIIDSAPFIETNIKGTSVLLDLTREFNIKKYVQVSTDEVYGSLGEIGKFTELTPISPNSPYSASKASADHLVMAYVHTYGINAMITRCSNNYGPFQFPEKLIPLMIMNALNNKELPVYGDGMNVRDWIHVDDHCSGIWAVYQNGKSGESYNIGSDTEKTNIEIVKLILNILGKPESLIKYVKDRPGHDRRYAMDSSKIQELLGWKAVINFDEGIKNTVTWYLNNLDWCNRIIDGSYMEYYNLQYGNN